jgi:hypothetical protein
MCAAVCVAQCELHRKPLVAAATAAALEAHCARKARCDLTLLLLLPVLLSFREGSDQVHRSELVAAHTWLAYLR